MTAMDSSPDGNVLLTGHPDHLLRLWDTRQEGVAASAAGTKRLKSHSEWVSAVSWSKSNENWVLSAAHDGRIKLWDIRSSIPLHTVVEITGKALCAGWSGGSRVLGGGTDCRVHISQIDGAAASS